jgi:hypothetical protein
VEEALLVLGEFGLKSFVESGLCADKGLFEFAVYVVGEAGLEEGLAA